MDAQCPTCRQIVDPDNVNAEKGVAFCRECAASFLLPTEDAPPDAYAEASSEAAIEEAAPDELHRPIDEVVQEESQLEESPPEVQVALTANPDSPPDGAWYSYDGMQAVVGATVKSKQGAMILGIVTAALNFLTWGFLLSGAGKPPPPMSIPQGLPPEMAQHFQQANIDMANDTSLYWMLSPFMLLGVLTAIGALMFVIGKLEVRLRGDDGEVFLGMLGMGWKKRFIASEVRGVYLRPSGSVVNGRRLNQVVLEGTNVRFGTGLSEERQKYVAGVLRKLMRK